MDQKQSMNFSADFLEGFSSAFMKLVFVIIAVYIIIMILNLVRDKFINKEVPSKRDDILDLLTILNKLFFVSGFGFIIGNILQMLFSEISDDSVRLPSSLLRGEWEYLTFGIILIFIGVGFGMGKKVLKREKTI